MSAARVGKTLVTSRTATMVRTRVWVLVDVADIDPEMTALRAAAGAVEGEVVDIRREHWTHAGDEIEAFEFSVLSTVR